MKTRPVAKIRYVGNKRCYFIGCLRVSPKRYNEYIESIQIGKSTAGLVRAWPLYSDAAGCHPKQVKEAMEFAAKMGVPTEYTPDKGQAVFTSKDHQKRFLKVHGMHNRDGGY